MDRDAEEIVRHLSGQRVLTLDDASNCSPNSANFSIVRLIILRLAFAASKCRGTRATGYTRLSMMMMISAPMGSSVAR